MTRHAKTTAAHTTIFDCLEYSQHKTGHTLSSVACQSSATSEFVLDKVAPIS